MKHWKLNWQNFPESRTKRERDERQDKNNKKPTGSVQDLWPRLIRIPRREQEKVEGNTLIKKIISPNFPMMKDLDFYIEKIHWVLKTMNEKKKKTSLQRTLLEMLEL